MNYYYVLDGEGKEKRHSIDIFLFNVFFYFLGLPSQSSFFAPPLKKESTLFVLAFFVFQRNPVHAAPLRSKQGQPATGIILGKG